MDGRQYFPNYGATYQQVPEFNATGYGRGYGVPASYFMPGSNAGIRLGDVLRSSKSYADVCCVVTVLTHCISSFCSATTAARWIARWTWYAYKLWPAD